MHIRYTTSHVSTTLESSLVTSRNYIISSCLQELAISCLLVYHVKGLTMFEKIVIRFALIYMYEKKYNIS